MTEFRWARHLRFEPLLPFATLPRETSAVLISVYCLTAGMFREFPDVARLACDLHVKAGLVRPVLIPSRGRSWLSRTSVAPPSGEVFVSM
jgi:hypothetical protein